MTKVLTEPKYYTAIANAIRAKNGSTMTYKPSGMADAITALTTSNSGGYTVTLKQTANQTINVTANTLGLSGNSSSSEDITMTPKVSSLSLSVVADYGYKPGHLIIDGETQTTARATVDFNKDYVVSATEATNTLPAECAFWRLSPVLGIISPTLPEGIEQVSLSRSGTKYLATSVSTAAIAVLKKLTPYATTDGATWTTDVTISSVVGYSFTLPSPETCAVIWAASEADRDLVAAAME